MLPTMKTDLLSSLVNTTLLRPYAYKASKLIKKRIRSIGEAYSQSSTNVVSLSQVNNRTTRIRHFHNRSDLMSPTNITSVKLASALYDIDVVRGKLSGFSDKESVNSVDMNNKSNDVIQKLLSGDSRKYTCHHCNETGHNINSCPSYKMLVSGGIMCPLDLKLKSVRIALHPCTTNSTTRIYKFIGDEVSFENANDKITTTTITLQRKTYIHDLYGEDEEYNATNTESESMSKVKDDTHPVDASAVQTHHTAENETSVLEPAPLLSTKQEDSSSTVLIHTTTTQPDTSQSLQ